ncbi:MAG: hypothetical protein KF751_06840 [Nitrospira sp.]|nr:hypothetical protein [Nitrospira sp.]
MARARAGEQQRPRPKTDLLEELSLGINKFQELLAAIHDLSQDGFPYRDAARSKAELKFRECLRQTFGERSQEYQTYRNFKIRTGDKGEIAQSLVVIKGLIQTLQDRKLELHGLKPTATTDSASKPTPRPAAQLELVSAPAPTPATTRTQPPAPTAAVPTPDVGSSMPPSAPTVPPPSTIEPTAQLPTPGPSLIQTPPTPAPSSAPTEHPTATFTALASAPPIVLEPAIPTPPVTSVPVPPPTPLPATIAPPVHQTAASTTLSLLPKASSPSPPPIPSSIERRVDTAQAPTTSLAAPPASSSLPPPHIDAPAPETSPQASPPMRATPPTPVSDNPSMTLSMPPMPETVRDHDPLALIRKVCQRFHSVARHLRLRKDYRPTIEVDDEYDLQDLLCALLKVEFDEVATDEWIPPYTEGASRTTLLVNRDQIAIVAKKTGPGLTTKELTDQVLADAAHYRTQGRCSTLFCFVYDPEGRIGSPKRLETTLTSVSEHCRIEVLVAPK